MPLSTLPLTSGGTVEGNAPPLDFELDGVERGLYQVDVGPAASDHEFAIGPVGIFVSADQEGQGELFQHVIVCGLEIVIGKRGEDGAWFGDVLDEEFVSNVCE